MTERPIILRDREVRAVLAGTKTQHRVPLKPQPSSVEFWKHGAPTNEQSLACATLRDSDGHGWTNCGPFRAPYQVGDTIWVRECYAMRGDVVASSDKAKHYLHYRASYGGDLRDEWHGYGRWRSSASMPRWASRLTLRVTDVCVQRVQDIEEHDALHEVSGWVADSRCDTARDGFREYWRDRRGVASWAANPWAWALTWEIVDSR